MFMVGAVSEKRAKVSNVGADMTISRKQYKKAKNNILFQDVLFSFIFCLIAPVS